MLRSIVKEHVKPADNNKSIRLHAYFKPFKLKSMFPTRPRKNAPHTSHVVYQFSCNLDGCNASYIGYTTCTMERRAKQHRYKGSGIHDHLKIDHEMSTIPNNIIDQFKVIHKSSDKINLRIAEALLIKLNNPYINVKFNEMSNFLNVYR